MVGYLKNIVANRGFGFIRAANTEYFFHRDDFKGNWDDLVETNNAAIEPIELQFDRVEAPKGPRAANVKFVQ